MDEEREFLVQGQREASSSTQVRASLRASDGQSTAPSCGPLRSLDVHPHARRNGFAKRYSAWQSQRRLPESNRRKRLCRPLRNHSAKAPQWASVAAGRVRSWARSS